MTVGRYITSRFQRMNSAIMDKMHDAETLRIRLIGAVFTIVLLVGLVHAANQTMSVRAIGARVRLKESGFVTFKNLDYRVLKTQTIKGMRGRILDRTAREVFAQSSMKPALIFKGPEFLRQGPADTARVLSQATGLPEDRFLWVIARKWPGFVVQRNLGVYKATLLQRITTKYGGFVVRRIPTRNYPASLTASNLIGLMSKQGIPLFGAERGFDKVLKAKQDRFKAYVDHKTHIRLAVDVSKAQAFDPAQLDGSDVVLTVDQRIQAIAYMHLARQVKVLGAKGGAAIVMDPKTFQVLAMASVPAISMSMYTRKCVSNSRDDDGSSPCTNKAIQFSYEPGSVGKVFSLATAIEHHVVDLTSMLDTHHGTCKIGSNTVHDTHYSKSRWITVIEATKHSSNCAFAFLGKKEGPQMLYNGLKALGLGRRTGIGLPGEQSGYIVPVSRWKRGITEAGVSYGYGYRVTPLQIARAISIIANNGMGAPLNIKLRVQSQHGKVLWQAPKPHFVRIISRKTAVAVRKAMIAVTQKGGTGTLAVPEGICVGGKTGTAKINVRGHYRAGHYVATFAGFAPCDDPRLVIVVTIIDPKFHKYGGSAAGPVFRDLVRTFLPMVTQSKEAGI